MKAGGGARVWLSMRNAAGTEQGREAARLPGPLGNAAHLPLLGQRRAAAGGPARRTASHGGARVAASLAPCGDAGHVPWEALSPPGEGWACSISVTCLKKEVL